MPLLSTTQSPSQLLKGGRPLPRAAARGYSTRIYAKRKSWIFMHRELTKDLCLRTIAVEEAAALAAAGKHVLVDVRLPSQYESAHVEGAVSVPLYTEIGLTNFNASNGLKWMLMASQGVTPVADNEDFASALNAAVAGGKNVILYCEAGGTLIPTQSFPLGKVSRSLQAAHAALTEKLVPGGGEVLHLERGIYGWSQAGLPIAGDYTPDIGRSPAGAVDPTLAFINQERGYELAESDAPIEPEKKKGFFGLF